MLFKNNLKIDKWILEYYVVTFHHAYRSLNILNITGVLALQRYLAHSKYLTNLSIRPVACVTRWTIQNQKNNPHGRRWRTHGFLQTRRNGGMSKCLEFTLSMTGSTNSGPLQPQKDSSPLPARSSSLDLYSTSESPTRRAHRHRHSRKMTLTSPNGQPIQLTPLWEHVVCIVVLSD